MNAFLNFIKDKEHKLGTEGRAFHKMGDLFENDMIPERDEGLSLYGPYILESVEHDGFAFMKKGGFP